MGCLSSEIAPHEQTQNASLDTQISGPSTPTQEEIIQGWTNFGNVTVKFLGHVLVAIGEGM